MTISIERLNILQQTFKATAKVSEAMEAAALNDAAAAISELLAVREAQPVGISKIIQIAAELVKGDLLSALWEEAERSKIIRTERLQRLLDDAGEAMKVRSTQLKQACEHPAPPAPAVPSELLDAMAEVIRISDRDHEAWGRAKAAISACRTAMRGHSGDAAEKMPDDTRRMDWLVAHHVEVRKPLLYGSEKFFTAQTLTDKEDDYHATSLREQIDAAMAAAPTPTKAVNDGND